MENFTGASLVEDAFQAFPETARERLWKIRDLIFKTAETLDGVGTVEETLKWGQPSYLTVQPKSGTTVRLGLPKDREDAVAVFFHCQTNLASTFRELYEDKLEFEGNRAIVLPLDRPLPEAALAHCIALALTYHQRKGATSKAQTRRSSHADERGPLRSPVAEHSAEN